MNTETNSGVFKSAEETKRQLSYIEKCKEIVAEESRRRGRPMRARVTTFGCQMNARDSEKLRGILLEAGFLLSETEEGSDLVILNTCTVRENANNKVYGRLGYLHGYKKKDPSMKLALCGCMMQEPTVIETLKKSYRFVDLVFGTHNIFRFPELLYRILTEDGPVYDIWDGTEEIVEDLPAQRKYPFKSGVNIMFGCNNFCTYCIVPYVRGRERSREPKDILREIETLVADGVIEVMLLGQNVNSYGKTLDAPVSFAELLDEVAGIDGLKRVRFMTSHPKDLSPELIEVMAKHDNICRHFHLPLQSGSDRILKAMNRHYDRTRFLSLTEELRKAMPDIAITTDIIVGFPGETEEDFLQTADMVERVRFDSAFTFLYSRRTGTPAASYADDTPESVVKDRFSRLLKRVQEIGREKAFEWEGRTEPVLIEQINEQDPALVTGRLSNNSVVHLKGDASMIGQILPVRLSECKGFYYLGETADA